MQFKKNLLSAAIAVGLMSAQLPAFAASSIEEIIVTSRKTVESVQSTPIAVTALSGGALELAQVTEIADMKRTTPNLSILSGGTGSSALVFVSIRGAAQVAPGGAADASVGTYIDGVYFARPTGGNLDMFDVQRVEVLRGPQGTLFGRNTTGGAISVTSNDPSNELEGSLKVDLGNYNSRKFEGVLNIPLIDDELGVRFALRYKERDGYGDYKSYTDPNGFVFEGLDQEASKLEHNTFGRLKVLWEPSDTDVVVKFGADWGDMKDTGQRTKTVAINEDLNGGFLGAVMAAQGFDADHFINQQSNGDTYWNADNSTINSTVYNDAYLSTPQSTNENSGAYFDIEYELGDFVAKSVTSYRASRSTGVVDLDGTPLNMLTFHSVWDQHQWSQEFQFNGSLTDSLDMISGLYYFVENSSEVSRSRAFGLLADTFAPGVALANRAVLGSFAAPVNAGSHGDFENTSVGAFAQFNYMFTDDLRAMVGVRYTKDTRDVRWAGQTPEINPYSPDSITNCTLLQAGDVIDNPGVCAKTDSEQFEYPAWVIGLDYQVTADLFVYAKTSGASMAGGWNTRATKAPAFKPENVMDVESGFKVELLDNTMRINGALFYSQSDDQQRFLNEYDPVVNSVTQYVINAGESHAYGAEFELTWLLWEGMTLTSTAAFLETKYDQYTLPESLSFDPTTTVLVDHSEEHAPQAPEKTFSLAATQILDIAIGEVELHADYYWVDETWFQDTTVRPGDSASFQAQQLEEKKWNSIPSYGLVNAQATLRLNEANWEFTLWGKNLADKEYYVGVANFYTAFGAANRYYGSPREYGLSAKYVW